MPLNSLIFINERQNKQRTMTIQVRMALHLFVFLFLPSFLLAQQMLFHSSFPQRHSPISKETETAHSSIDRYYHQLFKKDNSTSYQDSGFQVLGRWAWGPCYAVDVKGGNAFVGNGVTFQALDICNSSLPKIIGECLTEGAITDIKLKDSLAFVINGKGLLILNVSIPSLPKKLGEITIPLGPLRVAITDSFVYVTVLSDRVYAVDITDPTQPKLRGGIPVGGDLPFCIAAKGRFVYVGNPEWSDLALIDATDPDTLRRSFIPIGGWGHSAFVKDTLLFVGMMDYDGKRLLKIFDISKPDQPIELGNVQIGDSSFYSNLHAVTVSENYAYVATSDSGVYSIGVANPSDPVVLSHIKHKDFALSGGFAIASTDGNLFVAYLTGMWVIKKMSAGNMEHQAFFPLGYFAEKIQIRNNFAFIASGFAGLWLLDISDLSKPRSIANINTGGYSSDIELSDNYVYIVNYAAQSENDTSRGLWIIDISDIYHPHIVSHHVGIAKFHYGASAANSVRKEGDYVYMTQARNNGDASSLEIIDVSNPLQPATISIFKSSYTAHNLDVNKRIVYLATIDGGLRIVDCTDPSNPIEISHIYDSTLVGITVSDSFAFVNRPDSFAVFNISNPQTPLFVGGVSRDFGSYSYFDMTRSNNFVYFAEGYLGAIDVSNPANPKERAYFYGRHWGRGVAAKGDTILFADLAAGVWILRNNTVTLVENKNYNIVPKGFELYQNYPNPFNPQTTIEFSVSKDEKVVIDIYNLLGQKIAMLLNEIVRAGIHKISYNGINLSSGVYFYRLITPDGSTTKIMTVVK
jgi:hypothetical protein